MSCTTLLPTEVEHHYSLSYSLELCQETDTAGISRTEDSATKHRIRLSVRLADETVVRSRMEPFTLINTARLLEDDDLIKSEYRKVALRHAYAHPLAVMVYNPTGKLAVLHMPLSPISNPIQDDLPTAPKNFGDIGQSGFFRCNRIYRSSYPQPEHFPFLRVLGLKTIITLVGEPIAEEYRAFIDDNGIKHLQFDVPANKSGSAGVTSKLMDDILDSMADCKQPMLIHCNKGKHRTGCVVACWQKTRMLRCDEEVLSTYQEYAGDKAREGDRLFIKSYGVGPRRRSRFWVARQPRLATIEEEMATVTLEDKIGFVPDSPLSIGD